MVANDEAVGLSPRLLQWQEFQRWLKGDLPRQVMISSYEKASGSGVNLEQFETDFLMVIMMK